MGFHSRRAVQSAGGPACAGCVGRNRSIRSSASQQSPAGRAVPLVVEEIDDSCLAMVKAVEACLLPPSPLAHSYGRGVGGEGPIATRLDKPFHTPIEQVPLGSRVATKIRSRGSLMARFPSRARLGRRSTSFCFARMERLSMSRCFVRMSG